MCQCGFGISWCGSRCLTDIDFTNYIMPLGVMKNVICTMTEKLGWEVAKIGLYLSANKMIIRIGYVNGNNNVPLMIGQYQIKELDELTYLGNVVATDGNTVTPAKLWKPRMSFKTSNPSGQAGQSPPRQSVPLHQHHYVIGNICVGSMEDTSKDCMKDQCISAKMSSADTSPITRYIVKLIPVHSMMLSLNAICDLQAMSRHVKTAILWKPPHSKQNQGWAKVTWHHAFIDDLKVIDITWVEAEITADNWPMRHMVQDDLRLSV